MGASVFHLESEKSIGNSCLSCGHCGVSWEIQSDVCTDWSSYARSFCRWWSRCWKFQSLIRLSSRFWSHCGSGHEQVDATSVDRWCVSCPSFALRTMDFEHRQWRHPRSKELARSLEVLQSHGSLACCSIKSTLHNSLVTWDQLSGLHMKLLSRDEHQYGL